MSIYIDGCMYTYVCLCMYCVDVCMCAYTQVKPGVHMGKVYVHMQVTRCLHRSGIWYERVSLYVDWCMNMYECVYAWIK